MDIGQQRRYGHAPELWEAAREEVRGILVGRARAAQTIAYSELTERLNTIRFEPDSHALAAMLGEISEDEDALGRAMLSVLVVHKDGDLRPGPGFFKLAKKLDRDTSDPERCWIEEFKRVVSIWQS